MNSVTVIGNLGSDPQVRDLPSGQKVANISVATTERYTDRNRARQQRTEWHRVVAFGKLAETCERYLGKGRQVYIEGRLTTREYEAEDGSGRRYRTEIVARQIRFSRRSALFVARLPSASTVCTTPPRPDSCPPARRDDSGVGVERHFGPNTPRDTDATTAVCFVNEFNGLGIQSVLAIPLLFGTQFENFVFVGLGAIDSSRFKGEEEIDNLRRHTEEELKKYLALISQRGYCAEYHYALGTDPVDGLERLAHEVAHRFPRAVFFAGKRIFPRERFWHRVLHNRAAYTLGRRLQFAGLQTVVLSVRAG